MYRGTPYVGRHDAIDIGWSPFRQTPTPPKTRSPSTKQFSPLFTRTPDIRRNAKELIAQFTAPPPTGVGWNIPGINTADFNRVDEALTQIVACRQPPDDGRQSNKQFQQQVATIYETSERFQKLWNDNFLVSFATVGIDSSPRGYYGSAMLRSERGKICYKNVLSSVGEYINKAMAANLMHMSEFYQQLRQMGFEGSDLRTKIFYEKPGQPNFSAAELYRRGMKYLINSGISAEGSKKQLKFYKTERTRLQAQSNNLANAYEELKADLSQLKLQHTERMAAVRAEIANMRDDRSQLLAAQRNEKVQHKAELTKLGIKIKELEKQKEKDLRIVEQYKRRYEADQQKIKELKEKLKKKPAPKPRAEKRKISTLQQAHLNRIHHMMHIHSFPDYN